ncbi:MAG: hypothetical protein Q4D57_01830 [Clostridia bacterium]|nr:hypothetical protein [Clostridia bacterium]
MNFKKLFVKTISAVLSFTILAVACSNSYAIPAILQQDLPIEEFSIDDAIVEGTEPFPEEIMARFKKLKEIFAVADTIPEDEIKSWLGEEIDHFKKLGEGYFVISDEVTPSINPLAFAIILNKINSFFERFPNIRQKLIELIKIQGGHPFTIKASNKSGDVLGDKKLVYPLKFYGNILYPPALSINTDIFGKNRPIKSTAWNIYVSMILKELPMTKSNINDLIGSLVIHELGHLIQCVCYEEYMSIDVLRLFKQSIRDIIAAAIRRDACPPNRSETLIELFTFPFSMDHYKKLNTKVLDIARKNGYMGDEFVSRYAQTDPIEWYPELLSRSICGKEHNGLDRAALEFIGNL